MALKVNKWFLKCVTYLKPSLRYKSQRRNLGKPPGIARNLEQRLQELYYKDPEVHYKVNIGFALKKLNRREVTSEHIKHLRNNKNSPELEELSRNKKLMIPLDEVEQEWSRTVAPYHIKTIAEHYAIYEHLFGDAYFFPVVTLDIDFKGQEKLVFVHWGNVLKPEETMEKPNVQFESTPDSLWTLVLTTPDCHYDSEVLEYCHWFIGNIKGGDINTGEQIINYMQPLPLQGVGYLRYIFVLYKQEDFIDYSELKPKTAENSLKNRSFSTYQFYKKHQKQLTPAGLSFFTSDWDQSVTDYLNKEFLMEAHSYAYDFPEHYYKKQKWFPLRQPFNLYLDRYRDKKEIAKEYLLKKLKVSDPFKAPPKPYLFPNAIPFKPGTPSWLKNELRKERLRLARYNDYL